MQINSSNKKWRKRNLFRFAGIPAVLLLCSLIWATGLKAQMSGTYTICSSGCNYSTFASAITDLQNKGVSAAVTFNVSPGTYSEVLTIAAITGASTKNTITFQGAGRTKTILTSSGQTVYFNYSKYVTFDQMTISTSATSGYLIKTLYDVGCGVTNSNIISPAYTAASVYEIYSQYATNFSLINNSIIGGYYSYYNYGSQGSSTIGFNTCKNNRFVHNGYMDIYAYYGTGNTYTGNVFDSSVNGYGYGFYSIYETGTTFSNNIMKAVVYYDFIIEYQNYYNIKINGQTLIYSFTNNFCSNFTQYGGEWIALYASALCVFAHNTIVCPSGSYYAVLAEYEYCSPNTQVFTSNIIETASSYAALYLYMYSSGTWPQPFLQFDGNDIYSTGGTYFYNGSSGASFSNYADYSKYMQASGLEMFGTSMPPPFVNAPSDLHLKQTAVAPSGIYAGIDVDIDGDARCKLFPTAGADESFFGKSKPIVKFFVPTNLFPGSPTYVYQTAKAGEPKVHHWYLNGVWVSDSVVLKTSKFVTGTNCLKLVTQTCGGNDSFTQCFTVSAPTSVPGTDFIANKNTIQAGQIVSFTDLSSNGPTKWLWSISPDSTLDNGVKVPAIKFVFGSSGYQNPQVRFDYGGKYKVCMTATNGVGKGATVCKTNYINVIPAINLKSGTQTTKFAQGYLYDNGGPNGGYTYDGTIESILIDPCADSVFLSFSMIDTYCGYDYIRLYEGKDNSGKPLWNSKCSSTGYSGYGPGFTGGKSISCSYSCLPDFITPDIFKAKSTMFLTMNCIEPYYPAGFAAYWWSTPKTSNKPTASFTSSNAGDSVCTNAALNYTNTTKINPDDVATFLWDLDGDLSTFECVGACKTASYPYFLTGPVKVTLIATNCGGSDTAVRTLTVYDPKKPVASFIADNTNATTNDIVFLTSTTVQCVDDYKWTITKNGTTNTTFAKYMNGTSDQSPNPQVNFTDTGWYDIKMFVDNASGAQTDQITKTKYIHVRSAYCIPSVAIMNQGLGISHVIFNTIDNKMTQAATEYSNYTTNSSLSTTIAIGASYNITVSRDPSLIFEAMNRDVYIDWNQDGSFAGTGEVAAQDSNSYAADFTAKITVPKYAKTGATTMRIAVNRGSYANKPCGQNQFGEYQDYRIYVTPYNILPIITLKGHQGSKDTIKIEQGNKFVEEGYKATSFLYGDITKDVLVTSKVQGGSGPFNNVVPGIYIFSYNVTDSAGNKAITQIRLVQVTKDITPPALIVASPDTIYIEVTKLPTHPVPVPKVISADDLVDGPLAGSVIVDSGKVQTNIVGTYVVSYTVTDLSNNTIVVYRVVEVIDTVPPTMILIGNDPQIVEVYNSYTEQGVTVLDNYNTPGQLNPRVIISSNVDTAHIGTYTVTYNLSDESDNDAATVTRTVKVVDTLPPTIALNGAQLDSVDVFHAYSDMGVTVSENYDKTSDVAITITGTFYTQFPAGKNPNVLGSYTIIYTATDKSGNMASVTRTVLVVDHVAPLIELAGDAALSVCRWFPYVDAGYTVSDNYYTAPTGITVTHEGTFYTNGGTTMWGLLTIRYKAEDGSHNIGYTDWRYIQVKHEDDFTCVNTVNGGMNLDKNISVYPNPSTGTFTVNANLPSQEKVRISVTNLLGQEIEVIHNGILTQNSFRVDMSNQPGGVYMLNIVTENQTITKRIAITK